MKSLTFEQMEQVNGGSEKSDSVNCNLAWNLAGAPWSIGIGVVGTPFAGAAFSIAWGVAGSIICP